MKKLTLLLLGFVLSFAAIAGNNDKTKSGKRSISGKVISLSGEEIPAAKITVKETSEIFYADLEGNFNFQLPTDKIYSISIETIGYQSQDIKSNEIGLSGEISLQELR